MPAPRIKFENNDKAAHAISHYLDELRPSPQRFALRPYNRFSTEFTEWWFVPQHGGFQLAQPGTEMRIGNGRATRPVRKTNQLIGTCSARTGIGTGLYPRGITPGPLCWLPPRLCAASFTYGWSSETTHMTANTMWSTRDTYTGAEGSHPLNGRRCSSLPLSLVPPHPMGRHLPGAGLFPGGLLSHSK